MYVKNSLWTKLCCCIVVYHSGAAVPFAVALQIVVAEVVVARGKLSYSKEVAATMAYGGAEWAAPLGGRTDGWTCPSQKVHCTANRGTAVITTICVMYLCVASSRRAIGVAVAHSVA